MYPSFILNLIDLSLPIIAHSLFQNLITPCIPYHHKHSSLFALT